MKASSVPSIKAKGYKRFVGEDAGLISKIDRSA
jgi:hypothetical protein